MKVFLRYAVITTLLLSFPSYAEKDSSKVNEFAEDVLLHVVLHEIGHGLIREFDLPVLGNEETMADAFATYYLTQYLPERALDVLSARTKSLVFEANELDRDEWRISGEHNNDARRAYQIAALAIAADVKKYASLAEQLGMSEADQKRALDYGTEIHRSWRRILRHIIMPTGMESQETRVGWDPDHKLVTQFRKGPFLEEVKTALKRFDWHTQVRVFFLQGDGGASWSRSNRTITVSSEYIHRFIEQARQLP